MINCELGEASEHMWRLVTAKHSVQWCTFILDAFSAHALWDKDKNRGAACDRELKRTRDE